MKPLTAEEIEAVGDWVKGGGALLLIADHAHNSARALRMVAGITTA